MEVPDATFEMVRDPAYVTSVQLEQLPDSRVHTIAVPTTSG